MHHDKFLKLEKNLQALFAERRVKELLGIALKLVRAEDGSGEIQRFLLFRLPGDTVFAHKASAPRAAFEKASVFFRLAELCRDKGALEEMDKLLALYLRDGRDELNSFLALCLTCNFSKAYALAPALLQKAPSPETLASAADPWGSIYRTSRIKRALAGVEAALKGLRGPAKSLAALHRFVLAEKAGQAAAFSPPGALSPERAVLHLPAAEILLNRLEFKKAEKIFRVAAAAWPASEQACGKLAETMFCAGKQEAALELLAGKQALISSPGFRAWRGQLLLFRGRYKEAVEELRRPIASGNALGWCWRGAALFKLGSCGPALSDLDAAIRINPDDLEARVWRAELLRARKEKKRAQEDLGRTLSLMPAHPWALANLALMAAERGDADAFSSAYERLPEAVRLACGRQEPKPAFLSGLLWKLKGVRRHELRFFYSALNVRQR